MLTLTEIMMYEPFMFGTLVLSCIIFGVAVIAYLYGKDRPLQVFAGLGILVGICLIAFVLGSVVLDRMEYTTITPCNMIPDERLGVVIGDCNGNTYQAPSTIALKLHLNQSSDIVAYHFWLSWQSPVIVNATGNICPANSCI